jgi:YVTN family beta-propeller protein
MKYLMQCCSLIRGDVRKKMRGVPLLCEAVAASLMCAPILSGQVGLQPAVGLINPQAILFNTVNGRVYGVDSAHNAVVIVDDQSETKVSVLVGAGPVALAVDSNKGSVYVVNAGDGTVSVLDSVSNAVTATIPVGAHPYSIAIDAGAGRVYVSHTFSNQVSVLDTRALQVTNVVTGSADLIAINRNTHRVFLLGYEGGDVATLSDSAGKASHISVGSHAWGMTLDNADGSLYVAKTGEARVAVVKPAINQVTYLATGEIPCAIAIDARSQTMYVANYGADSISVINLAKDIAIASIPVGRRPQAIAIDEEENVVYVANTEGGTVSVIDGDRKRLVGTVRAGQNPYALTVNPFSHKVHVANVNQASDFILDLQGIPRNSSPKH